MLFDIYGEEVTPSKGRTSRQRDRAAMAMFLKFFGRDRRPETLSQRDWDRFIQARRAGTVGPSGQPVGDRMIEWDLTFLMAVLNWAARSRDEQGRLLLDRNPLKGLRKPREKNPNRVVLTEAEYRALLGVSRGLDWRFHVALVLAHETGHRIGAIRNLRWSDVDFEGVRGVPGGALLVEPGGAPRRTRSEAREGLALAEAQVCQRPDGPPAQGALRTRRVEGGQDGAALLPAARRGATEAGNPKPPQAAGLKSTRRESNSGNAPAESPKFNASRQIRAG